METLTTVKVMLDDGAKLPDRAHRDDAGLDLFSMVDCIVPAKGKAVIETGVHMDIPPGFVGLLTSKSGLMAKNNLTCRGTIDAGYTGAIRAVVFNHGSEDFEIHAGDKVTQIVILPCATPSVSVVDSFTETERGDNGFGSTGV